MESKQTIITYIIAIIAVNIVCLYLRHLMPDNKGTVTVMHVFFGGMQLMHLVPKIVSGLKKT